MSSQKLQHERLHNPIQGRDSPLVLLGVSLSSTNLVSQGFC